MPFRIMRLHSWIARVNPRSKSRDLEAGRLIGARRPSFSFSADLDSSSSYGRHHSTRPASPEELVSDGDPPGTISTDIPSREEPDCKGSDDTADAHFATPVSPSTLKVDRNGAIPCFLVKLT